MLAGILWYEYGLALPAAIDTENIAGALQEYRHWKDWIIQVKREADARAFSGEFLASLQWLNTCVYGEADRELSDKFAIIASVVEHTAKPVQMAQEMTETPPLRQLENIRNYDKEKLGSLMRARYA